MTELNEKTENIEDLIVTIEPVLEDGGNVLGYNVYSEETDETIGYIFLNSSNKWEVADSDVHFVADNEEFETALNYLVNKYKDERRL